MPFDSTAGGSAANSYVSVAEADDYLSVSYGSSDWTSLSSGSKQNLLMQSTRILDQFFEWSGYIVDGSTQALRWPRTSAKDIDRRLIDAAVIPKALKHATIELALHLLRGETDSPTGFDVTESPLQEVRIGSLRVKLDDKPRDIGFPKIVTDMLNPIGSIISTSTSQAGQASLVRV